MKRLLWNVLSVALLATLGGRSLAQAGASPQSSPPSGTAQQSTGQKAAPKTGASKTRTAANSAMTNRDVIRLVKAKISDDIIEAKIKQSKTKFDTSVEGLVALKEAGVSDGLISVMVNAGNGSSQPAPRGASASPTAAKPGSLPASNASKEVVATDASRALPRVPRNLSLS